jgi:protein gp37
MTAIEWTERTWNPVVGCSIVSPGCTNCYAMRMAARLNAMGADQFPHYTGTTEPSKAGPVWTGKVALAPEATLLQPLRRKKPTMWFVNSMGDLFHEDVPRAWIDEVFVVMADSPQHTFQVLTKRAARMREYVGGLVKRRQELDCHSGLDWCDWPLPNVWLGVSAERQTEADQRIPDLLATPAAVRFVSAEPLLGPIEFSDVSKRRDAVSRLGKGALDGLHWVIVGGESGPGARPMHPDWARSIRDQCAAASVPFFFKQWGEWAPSVVPPLNPRAQLVRKSDGRHGPVGAVDGEQLAGIEKLGKSRAGRLLDGRLHDAMPAPRPEPAP